MGFVAQPREDRWHLRPTALFGGIAIFSAFIVPLLALFPHFPSTGVLAMGAGGMFILGLVDDLYELSPQGKFVGQLVIAAMTVAGGLTIRGIMNPALAIPLTIFWLVAITNAINILDNMDGLAGGVALVAALSLWAYSLLGGPEFLGPVALLLAGATSGFLVFNFNPAKVFMGDCGSLFLGFTLAALTVLGTWIPSPMEWAGSYTGVMNLVLVLVVPVSVLAVPLFDTALVTFTRTQTGRPVTQGGRDHVSHRLVLLGYSERRTVLTLMVWAAVASALVLCLSRLSAQGLLVVLVVLSVVLFFFGVFLSHLNGTIYGNPSAGAAMAVRRRSMLSLILNKKQILQVIVDTALITTAYVGAYLLRYEGDISEWNLSLIERSLPLLIPVKLVSFWAFGLYRGQWRYVSVGNLWEIAKAVPVSSLVIVGSLLYFYRFEGYSRAVFIIDCLLTLLLIGGVRLLMRLFREYFNQQAEQRHSIPVLIVGAGDGGELFLRELRRNPQHDFLPVGFVDDDPAKQGQVIHGIRVLGTREALPQLLRRHGVRRVFIAVMSASDAQLHGIVQTCRKLGVPCERVRPLLPIKNRQGSEPAFSQPAATSRIVTLVPRLRKK